MGDLKGAELKRKVGGKKLMASLSISDVYTGALFFLFKMETFFCFVFPHSPSSVYFYFG